MRVRFAVVFVLLFVASSAVAQQTRVSLLATDISYESSKYTGSHWSGGGALALNHFWTPRFSTELFAAANRVTSSYAMLDRSGNVVVSGVSAYTAYPIDLVAQYHFMNRTRWKPYVGAGARYTDSPEGVLEHGFSPELNAGVLFNMTPRLGLVFDARATYYENHHATSIDVKPAFGVSWRF